MAMTANTRARLVDVALPDFGMPVTEPLLPASIYADRMERLRAAMDERGYDHVVVWGDREHSANIAYLTGFDPRFEEAVLIVGPDGSDRSGDPSRQRVLRPGRGGTALDATSPVPGPQLARPVARPIEAVARDPERRGRRDRWPDRGRRLEDVLEPGDDRGSGLPRRRAQAGRPAPAGLVENATDLLIDPADGLRVINEVEQLAAFEWAACQTSSGVRRVLTGLQPGMTERECAQLLNWNGSPLSCHLMLTAGSRARYGLLSPGDRPLERGDPFTIAFGIWGALNCRAGFLVEDPSELPDGTEDYIERLVAPYFAAVADWYGALHVGQVGGELQAIVDRHLGDAFFGVSLNPGTSSTSTSG